jgi:mono/diheme cytochrome c family protein
LLLSLVLALLLALPPCAAATEGRTGEQIFQQQCASCHGKNGEGTGEEYPHALSGKKSVDELAKFIAKSMPKNAKVKCSGEDAQKVAAYIFDAFYSKAAQERNKPARIELSHLTVRQYRNAVADLIGSFRPQASAVSNHGLRGTYFKSYGFRPTNRVFQRIDPVIRFDFGEASPGREAIEPDRFSMRWEGSVIAPETGEYEFIVRTEHATRLWINDLKQPLIDAFVKSGQGNEHRSSILLLSGRAYLLKLEFAKGKQGEPDNKKKQEKPPPVKASIALEWKVPNRAVETIPERCLRVAQGPEVFVYPTAFPADDRSMGYERGTSVSKAWDQATTEAAIASADYVVRHLGELAETPPESQDRQRLREFCLRFVERAFRRPLTEEQKKLYVDRQLGSGGDFSAAVKRIVLLTLKSPRFLYHEIEPEEDAYDTAARLAFALWDSLPDQELLRAAATGQLTTREQVTYQAERMLADQRARAKVRQFLFRWLKVDQPPDLSKDPKSFPGFDASVASQLRTSLELFLDDVVWSDASDFRQLLLAGSVYLNGTLARFYGMDLPADAPFQNVALNAGDRAGVLTHPYLMAAFSHTQASSPIHRGVFLARNILGVSLRPPPDAFTPLSPELHPQLTTRERVTLQTSPQNCMTCHGVINPLGYTMEHFDAVGRFRAKEKDKPIDATGKYRTRDGKEVQFSGVRELATFLAGSQEVQETFVQKLFQDMTNQPIRAYGPRKVQVLRESFAQSGYNVRKLVIDIAVESALIGRDEDQQPAAQAR